MKQHLTKGAAAFMAAISFVSFMMAAALYREHPVAFVHALLLAIGSALVVAALLPFVVKYE